MHLILNRYHNLMFPRWIDLPYFVTHKFQGVALVTTYKDELENGPGIDALMKNTFEKIGKTDMAIYKLHFMTILEILRKNINAIHTGSWKVVDDDLWSRKLWTMVSPFSTILSSLHKTKFFSSNFSQSTTRKPYSSIPSNIWSEITMNTESKFKASWLSILRNEKQLVTNTRNANNIGCVHVFVHNQVSMKQLNHTRMYPQECVHDLRVFPLWHSCTNSANTAVSNSRTSSRSQDSQTRWWIKVERIHGWTSLLSKYMSTLRCIKRSSRLMLVKASVNKSSIRLAK